MNKTVADSGTWSLDEIRVGDKRATHQAVKGAAIGNLVEWYDFSLYSYTATIIAQVFFPESLGGSKGLIATFGTLAAAFVVRPLGGLIFGPVGDRLGRKRVLLITMFLMAVSTTATGLLPGYKSIGIWAPILLVTVRMCQGLSTGGEYAGAMTYVNEHASDARRGTMAAFLPVGTLTGYLTGAALFTALRVTLSSSDMINWGWRIPFVLGAPLAIVVLTIRSRIDKSPNYQNAGEDHKPSGREQLNQTVVKQWRALLICIGLELTIGLTSYMVGGYMPTYLKKTAGVPDTAAMVIIMAVLAVVLVAVVFVAKLSDRVGVKPLMWTGCALLISAAIPAFLLIRFGGGYLLKFLGVLIIGLAQLCFTGTEARTLPSLFPTNVRFGATSIGLNFSVSLFGGPTPLIAAWLVSATGNALIPAYMLIVAGFVGAIAVFFMSEVAGKHLPGSGPTVQSHEEACQVAGTQRTG